MLLVVLGVMSLLGGSESDDKPRDKSPPARDRFNAQVDCQDFVKMRLRAPSTADFPSIRKIRITGPEDGSWQVLGYVDSQNGFGAMVRTQYLCKIHYVGKTVFLDSLNL